MRDFKRKWYEMEEDMKIDGRGSSKLDDLILKIKQLDEKVATHDERVDCSSMYPPQQGVGVHVKNVCTYPPTPTELKNVTENLLLKRFLQNSLIKSWLLWKCNHI